MTDQIALVFDTETTGLPDWKKPADDPCQPRLAQLCAALIDPDGNELGRMNQFVARDGWEMPPEVTVINGITNAKLDEAGVPVVQVLEEFYEMMDRCGFITAYGLRFDQKITRGEARRAGLDDRYGYKPVLDLMWSQQQILGGPFFRKLSEAYLMMFDEEFVDAHTADGDVNAKIRLYMYCMERGAIDPKPQVSKR